MKKLIVLMAVMLSCGCATTTGVQLSAEDQQARKDDQGEINDQTIDDIKLFPDTALGRQLQAHLELMSSPSEYPANADQKLNASLKDLAKYPGKTVKLLSNAYQSAPEEWYFERWMIIKTLGDIQHDKALKTLYKISTSRIAAEKSVDQHHFSSQEEELILRIRGVEGLAQLAASGHKKAQRSLYNMAQNQDLAFVLRKRAVKGYLRSLPERKQEAAKQRLYNLPSNLHPYITTNNTSQAEFGQRANQLINQNSEITNQDPQEERLNPSAAPVIKTGEQQ